MSHGTSGSAEVAEALTEAELQVEGRLADASNATLRCVVATGPAAGLRCVYKPVSGERPLWDFPEWTLTRREVAAHALSAAAGWHLVPPTVWREDGPAGAGMCQLWIDDDQDAALVGVTRPGEVPPGWRHVLDAEDGAGRPLVLSHAADPALMRMAAFDVIVNNADRKGGHVLVDGDGRVWGIDHGVTFSVDDKLRTVLWGWAGEPIPDGLLGELRALATVLGEGFDPVDRWLAEDERERLRERIRSLIRRGVFPMPSGRWPAIPWPVF